MAQFRRPHPWDPHFALPGNVMAEPPGRGTLTTAQLPRKTISGRPKDWTGGFALPAYLKHEPSGRGAVHTHWARRKTIPQYIPKSLGDYPGDRDKSMLQSYLREGAPLALTLPQEVYAMDGDIAPIRPGGSDDPFKMYGERAAEYIMGTIHRVPKDFRPIALEALLNELRPGLYSKVTEKANLYRKKGMNSKAAVKAALASQIPMGLIQELIEMGTSKKPPKVNSLAGLGYYGDAAAEAIGLGVFSYVKKGAKAIGRGVKKAAQKTKSAIQSGAKKSWEWSKDALKKLGDLTCKVVSHKAAAPVAGAAGSIATPAVGAAAAGGVAAGAAVCAAVKGEEGGGISDEEFSSPQNYGASTWDQIMQSKWTLPVLLGGAAVVLYVVAK